MKRRRVFLLPREVSQVVQALHQLGDRLQEFLVALVKVEDGRVPATVGEVGPDVGAGVDLVLEKRKKKLNYVAFFPV